jgi:Dolichyl-phosphate-mannose-protein mannosyltransferase
LKPLTKNAQSHDEDKEDSAIQANAHSYNGLRPGIEWFIVPALTLIALIPRVILARQLDLVTDEIIYIMGGKDYLPLVLHHDFTSVGWEFNYEHPPLVKLLIGLSIYLNTQFVHRANELFVARIPSILSGTILIVAIYWLGRKPFGRVVAILAALALAVSPWLVYFSALAYLDMTMTMLITLAYLVLWYAIRQPRFYLLSAALVGLGAASKYTAALAIPGMILFTFYYFVAIRPRIPREQRSPVPWGWWIGALLLIPVVFFIADPAIWRNPYYLLIHSIQFEWDHSINGHLTFIAGQYSGHVPHWAVLYILLAKLSIFITFPAIFFTLFAVVQLVLFHLHKSKLHVAEITSIAFLLIWLVPIVGMFSLLNIVVGTHYHLPLAPAVALAGAFGLATLLRYRRGALFQSSSDAAITSIELPAQTSLAKPGKIRLNGRAAIICTALALLLVGPHLLGLTTNYAAEGYTSELFPSENSVLQVAYPGYREAGLWLIAHTHTSGTVGLVALQGTLNHGDYASSWFGYNRALEGRLKFSEAHPDASSSSFNYLVWPMHLVQRGYVFPQAWQSHIVHIVMGGNTIYCYIIASNPATIT